MVTGQLIFEENGSRLVNGSWAIGYWVSFSRLDRRGNELNKKIKLVELDPKVQCRHLPAMDLTGLRPWK